MWPDFSRLKPPPDETTKQRRLTGALVLAPALIVFVGSVLVAVLMLGIRPPAEWLPQGIRFDDAPSEEPSRFQQISQWGVLAIMLIGSLTATIEGSYQLFLGRRSNVNTWILRGVLVTIFVVGALAMVFSGCRVGRICQ